MTNKISIIIPVYNESDTILKLLNKVQKAKISNATKEIIVVDDGSNDETKKILQKSKIIDKLIIHYKNLGKGSAIKTALKEITGDIVIIQDADLEYDPNEYLKLLEPIINGEYSVVYGSRELNRTHNKHSSFLFFLGGKLLTKLTNLLYKSKLTDEATCYKLFKKDVILNLDIKSKGFEFCPEVTAKILKQGIPIKEVPISYNPRTKKQGKKIKTIDGLKAIWTLIKYS